MRFLFLLLPNLYDIFTLMMIGYAFMLHQKGELQISFGLACGLIYIATRLGIIAGKILHLILGQPQTDEVGEDEAGGKRFIFDFGPQIICVIAFQVIMMITSLPHAVTPAQVDKVAAQDKQIEQVEQKKGDKAENTLATDSTPAKNDYEEMFSDSNEETVVPQKIQPAVPTVSTRKYTNAVAKRSTYTPSQVTVTELPAAEPQQPVTPVVQKHPVQIPEKTLSIAGVSPAEININNAQRVMTPASNNQNVVISAATTSGVINSSSLTPKRYPGDDNPIPTTWGYYKQVPQTQAQQAQQINNQQTQQNNNRTIPANTLRTIGY